MSNRALKAVSAPDGGYTLQRIEQPTDTLYSPADPEGGDTVDTECRATLAALMTTLRAGGTLGQVFQPGLIDGLVVDLNLEHIEPTPDDTDLVGYVPDQYTAAYQMLQAVEDHQPTYDADLANGRGALVFDGDHWLDSTSFTEIPQPFTIVTVATAVGTGTPPSIIDSTDSSRVQMRAQGLINAGTDRAPTIGTLPSGLAVFVGIYDGADSVTRVGGSARFGLGDAGANSLQQLRIGAPVTPNGTNGFVGAWTRTLIYERRLKAGEIVTLEQSLAATYGAAA